MESVMRITAEDVAFFVTLTSIFLLGLFIQTHILLNWDVSWLMHASKKLLAGGTYSHDFFELNPPLILYLYLPPVGLTAVFPITIITALRCYIFLLGGISLWLCHGLIKNIFATVDKKLAYFFLLTIASVFFILPIEQFGQREHLLVILTLPYILGAVSQLQGTPLRRSHAILIGFCAGLGFAIKPYFLLTLVLIEFYIMQQRREALAWIRTEIMTICAVIAIYLMTVFTLHRDYLDTVLPLAARLYYVGISMSWEKLATNPAIFTCYFAGLFYFLQRKNAAYATLRTVLCLALSGFLASYFLQHTIWYSHALPAFSIAILLLMLEFVIFVRKPVLSRYDYFALSLLGGLVFGLLAYYQTPLRTILIFHPLNFFCYFAVLFAYLLSIIEVQKNLFRILTLLLIIIGIGYLFTNLVLQSTWYPYRFQLTVFMLILLFTLLVSRINISKYHATATATLGILLFSYAFYYVNYLYDSSLIKKDKMHPIIDFLHTYATGKPVDFLAATSFYTYPAVDYADAIPSSRFQFLGWVADIQKKIRLPHEHTDSQLLKDKDFLIAMLAADLNEQKPAFVLVDAGLHKENIVDNPFDYVSYFSQDATFRAAWQSYQYFTTLNDPTMYQFIVYKRIE
jgi:hypothetical protein